MERITEKEIRNFKLPDRPMTIREISIWNLINRKEMKKAKDELADLRLKYVCQRRQLI